MGRQEYTGPFGNDSARQLGPFSVAYGLTSNNYLAANQVTGATLSADAASFTAQSNGYGIGFSFPAEPGASYEAGAEDGTNCMVRLSWYAADGEYLGEGNVAPSAAAVGVLVERPSATEFPCEVSGRPWVRLAS